MPISVGGGSAPDIYTDIRTNEALVPYGSYNQLVNDANNNILNPSAIGFYVANGTVYNYQWQSGNVGGTGWQFPVLLGDTGVDGVVCNPTALASGVTAPTYYLPINAVITSITMRNTTANAVTGGITMGLGSTGTFTAPSGTQTTTAIALGANAMVTTPAASITLNTFPSLTFPAATYPFATYPNGIPIYFNAGSSWNSAVVNITIEFYVAF